MKSVKFLFLVAFMAMCVAFVKAQEIIRSGDDSFFKTKFNKEKVWDAMYSPVTPVVNQSLTISGLKGALDVNKVAIDWGQGRYLMFVSDADNGNTANSLADDVNNTTTKYNVSLKLFESNGTLVKVISKWGNIIAIGTKSFIYEAEGKNKIFFTFFDKKSTDIVNEKSIILAKATKLKQLPIVKTQNLVGKVKNYNDMKGFGFITTYYQNKNDITFFVHVSGLTCQTLRENTIVVFDLIEDGKNSVQATNVKIP